MPVFEFKSPDGKTYEVTAPEGASQEEAFAHLQTQLQAAPEPAPPTPAPPTPPEAAPAPPGGPRAPESYGGGGPPNLAPPEPARAVPEGAPSTEREMLWSLGLPTAQNMEVNPETGGNDVQNFVAGAGQSLVSTGRGIQQLWNYATGDKEDLARLQKEEERARKIDERLLGTKAGRTGQIAGYVGQALIPGTAAVKGTALAARAAGLTGRALPAVMAAEGMTGAATGAAMPTVEGESHARNAAVGGAIGALLPGVQRYAKPMIGALKTAAVPLKLITPYGMVKTVEGISSLAGHGLEGAKSILGRGAEAAKAAGEKAALRVASNVNVPRQAMVGALRELRDNFGSDLPESVLKGLDRTIGNAKGVVRGEKIEQMTGILRRSIPTSRGLQREAMGQFHDILDESLARYMTKAQRAAMKEARNTAATGRIPLSPLAPGRQAARAIIEQVRDHGED